MQSIRLSLVFHNHQPIGNFDGVIQQAFEDSYWPFLEVFEPFEHLKIALHTSGPLMLWLEENQPEYLRRVQALVAAGRVEIVGGPFYEPILTMLPSRDRVGQITAYRRWLEDRFETPVVGMWMPERVWESQLTRDIVPAGMQYTILDDYHFRAAGWSEDQLTNYFTTDDDGHVLRVFPGSERLRYLIPFAPPHETIEYCRAMAAAHPGATLLFGDDGEKFGTWPNTKAHVYEQGWLRSFFQALTDNRAWLHTMGPSEVMRTSAPAGRIYLPDCSYREMTEWSLPVAQQGRYDEMIHQLHADPRWTEISSFIRGGFWRNFRIKYSEAQEMYSRMLEVSRRLEKARREDADRALLPQATDHLYRGQCNCPYWHGAFGGIYLPHLRNATYRELIAADNLLEEANGREDTWVEATVEDYDSDSQPEIRLASDTLVAYLAPHRGGMLYELDVRAIQHNLLATMQRRPEVYHQKIRGGHASHLEDAASIHDRIVFKQEGLADNLFYDAYSRKSLIDHGFDSDITLDQVATSQYREQGDLVTGAFEAKLRRGSQKVQVQLRRAATLWGLPITVTKALTLEAGQDRLQVSYLLEGLPPGRPLHFGVEWNFAGMPAGAEDRFFFGPSGERLGQLGQRLDQPDGVFLGLIDQWLGVSAQIITDRPSRWWAFPIAAVSQSEGGFEMVHQSVCVMPHWMVQGDIDGRWSVRMEVVVAAEHTVAPRVGHEALRAVMA